MIALLLSFLATMSGQGSHAPAPQHSVTASAAALKPVFKPLTAHPLAG